MRRVLYLTNVSITEDKEYSVQPAYVHKHWILYIKNGTDADFRNIIVVQVAELDQDGDERILEDSDGQEIFGRIVGPGGTLYLKFRSFTPYLRIRVRRLYTDYTPVFDLYLYEMYDEEMLR